MRAFLTVIALVLPWSTGCTVNEYNTRIIYYDAGAGPGPVGSDAAVGRSDAAGGGRADAAGGSGSITISGVVRDGEGTAAANATVQAHVGSDVQMETTGPDGRFSFTVERSDTTEVFVAATGIEGHLGTAAGLFAGEDQEIELVATSTAQFIFYEIPEITRDPSLGHMRILVPQAMGGEMLTVEGMTQTDLPPFVVTVTATDSAFFPSDTLPDPPLLPEDGGIWILVNLVPGEGRVLITTADGRPMCFSPIETTRVFADVITDVQILCAEDDG